MTLTRGVGQLETTITLNAALIVEQGCKYFNMPQNTKITICEENDRFTMQNTITEDKLTNTFASGDKMTGDAPTARTGLALCHSHLGLCGTLVGPCKDTHGTPVPLRREAMGGPRHASRDNKKRQDQGHCATPWLPAENETQNS